MTSFETIRGHTLLSRGLHASQRVVDLGANHGEFSRDLSQRYGGDFTLVEANPELVHRLRSNTAFSVRHNAVGATSRLRVFNVAANDEASRLAHLPALSRHNAVLEQRVQVDEISLDELLIAGGDVIDVLKMDIEGAELEAFEAAGDATLARIAQMTVEFHCHPSFGLGGKARVEALLARLRTRGFLTIDFSGGTRMDVLILNRALISATRGEVASWVCQGAMSWSSYNAARARQRVRRALVPAR